MADCSRGLLSEAKSNQRLTVKLWEIHAHTTTCIKCVQKASLTPTSYEVRLPDPATHRPVHVVPSFSVIVLKIHTPPPWLLSVCVSVCVLCVCVRVWVFCLCTQSASDGTSSEETARQCRNTMRLQSWGLLGFCVSDSLCGVAARPIRKHLHNKRPWEGRRQTATGSHPQKQKRAASCMQTLRDIKTSHTISIYCWWKIKRGSINIQPQAYLGNYVIKDIFKKKHDCHLSL